MMKIENSCHTYKEALGTHRHSPYVWMAFTRIHPTKKRSHTVLKCKNTIVELVQSRIILSESYCIAFCRREPGTGVCLSLAVVDVDGNCIQCGSTLSSITTVHSRCSFDSYLLQ
eukprot:scaffold11292_cov67-Cyclotella_meneghiniana.AAC.6